MTGFIEALFFAPKWYHYPFILILLPFSWVYGVGMWIRRKVAKQIDFGLPIISVGNLVVGGSGKTPFVIALASRYTDVAVISRGYGRKSKGLIEVSKQGEVLVDVDQSGDEAMLMALSLPEASVIVSEERHQAIHLAKKQGAKVILLDDGFNRVEIKKFDLLLEPAMTANYYTFPAGPFREFVSTRRKADVIAKEGKEFSRVVRIEDPTKKMVLVTAISNPARLDRYLPKGIVNKVYYEDHAYFDEDVLKSILEENEATSIVCTSKDRVKMQGFKLPISEMKLKLEIRNEILTQVDAYVKGYNYA